MNPLVTSNSFLSLVANYVQSVLNSGYMFRLFQNNISPDPGTPLSDFVDSSFIGYTSWSLDGQIPTAIKQVDGEYVFNFVTPLFGCEGGSQTVYGAFISSGSNVVFSQRFLNPIPMIAGSSFVVPVQLKVVSLSIL